MISRGYDIFRKVDQPFNIIEEFSALNPKRKVLLCDHLFYDGYDSFKSTVTLLWPEATPKDVKKLEKFLTVLRRTVH